MDIKEESLREHKKLRGKLKVVSKGTVENMHDMSVYYTPGVGAVSKYVAEHEDEARDYIGTNNSVAIVSDGSAVLGLGDIGPKGAMPVMEGKSMLFNRFAGIDCYPIVLDVHTADEIVAVVKAIAPSFGGINLEDIAAPKCFEIEERLKAELDIPVMHDDQHGTAVVVLAGLINACKITNRTLNDSKIVLVGAGAAGTACAKLIALYAPKANILMVDSKGIVSADRTDLNDEKKKLLDFTNQNNESGALKDAVKDADIFIGVSQPNLIDENDVKTMATDPIIFAMANPDPEILPDVAKRGGVAVMATGRSDFPNQVNNSLAFPGIFRGALDNQVRTITDEHKIAAAEAIAGLIANPTPEEIIPDAFAEGLVEAVAKVIT